MPATKDHRTQVERALHDMRVEIIDRALRAGGRPVRRTVIERYGRHIGYSPFAGRWIRPWWWSADRLWSWLPLGRRRALDRRRQ